MFAAFSSFLPTLTNNEVDIPDNDDDDDDDDNVIVISSDDDE